RQHSSDGARSDSGRSSQMIRRDRSELHPLAAEFSEYPFQFGKQLGLNGNAKRLVPVTGFIAPLRWKPCALVSDGMEQAFGSLKVFRYSSSEERVRIEC